MRLSAVLCFLMLWACVLPGQEYFPPGVLGETPQEHEFNSHWYSRQLKALHEPSLWELSQRDPKAEVYRFLWLRSFHHPISVRLVVRSSGSGWMNSHMTSGKGGYAPGRITRYNIFWLTKSKTQSFLAALESADFWNLPTLLPAKENTVNLDGAQWILEGAKNGHYRIIDRWSPETPDPVRAIGMLALKLGRFKLRSTDLY